MINDVIKDLLFGLVACFVIGGGLLLLKTFPVILSGLLVAFFVVLMLWAICVVGAVVREIFS